MSRVILAASVLSADFFALDAALGEIHASGADWVHLDIMDGRFVPNITFGAKMVRDLRPHSSLIFDVHLMVEAPETKVENFAAAGADFITFHPESTVHSHRLLQTIHGLGKKAGISIIPSTPVSLIEPLLPFADLVLVMTVNPGFGGQALIPACLEKLAELRRQKNAHGYQYLVSVDGGINGETAPQAREKGADVLVAGSAFFNAPDKALFSAQLRGEQ